MNVSLNNSLDYLRMNSISGKRNLSGGNRKFSDIMTSNAEKVKSDKYLRGTSLPELTDEDYEYLSSKWNPNQMSKAEYEDFLGVLQEKGIISKDEKAYLEGERKVTQTSGSCYSPDYERPIEFGNENVLEYMRYEASLVYEPKTAETEWGVNLSKRVVSILEKMVKRRQ